MNRALSLSAFIAALAAAPVAVAQTIAASGDTDTQLSAAFASENVILDTRLLFADGAREAQQNLRGAFGWPTFQEGLVEGVYFRFDPDGYARFSPSPRLDDDVFEVVCRPRTYSCMAQKGALRMVLTDQKAIHLMMDGLQPTDQLFLADTTTELALPMRILEPLELQFERLLSTGGDLVVRRGENTLATISLKGFGAVTAYLRWISARQDYTVLPTGWPVPNARTGTTRETLTEAQNWVNPMPQPLSIGQVSQGAAYADEDSAAALDAMQTDLTELRRLLENRQNEATTIEAAQPPAADPVQEQMKQMEAMIQRLQNELGQLSVATTAVKLAQPLQQPAPLQPQPQFPSPQANAEWRDQVQQDVDSTPMPSDALPDEVRHLQYLVAEMGLDPKTALVLMQFIKPEDQAAQSDAISRSYHDTLAQTILEELEADLNASAAAIDLERALETSDNTKKTDAQADTQDAPAEDMAAAPAAVAEDTPAEDQAADVVAETDMAADDPTVELASDTQVAAGQSDLYQPIGAYFETILNPTQ